eukprot:GEMP01019273.1.p1 GENE.GEMP01019273.1~~GEMP01019273.1.p1  ORF type:complete len:482 (+),score=88.72 GEMP01019273.1:26-1471(+)
MGPLYEQAKNVYREKRLSFISPDVVGAVLRLQHVDPGAELALRLKWGKLLSKFRKYGHCSTGNAVTLLEQGDVAYPEMFRAMREANKRIWCETYIMDSSRVAEMVFSELIDAANRGVEVVLLVDWLGGFSVDKNAVQRLRDAGGEVVFFNPPIPLSTSVGPMSFRDHRKILVCDEVGFLGSMNLCESHAGPDYGGKCEFYDLHCKIEGPCVRDLAEVFKDSIRESGAEIVLDSGPLPEPKGDLYVQVLQSNVRMRKKHIQKVVQKSLNAADFQVNLTTSYFMPPTVVQRALRRAAARGVHLSLLLSGSSDFYPVPADLLAQHYIVERLLKIMEKHEGDSMIRRPSANAEVFLYEKQHLHAKFLTVDSCFSTIGSFNYDRYSARRNLEVCIAVFDPGFASQLQAIQSRKQQESVVFNPVWSNWASKAVCSAAYHLIWFSGKNYFDGLNVFNRKWLVRKAQLTARLEEGAGEMLCTGMMWGMY